jgi:plastocyanin
MATRKSSFALKNTPAYIDRHRQRTTTPIFWGSLVCIAIAIGGVFYSTLNQHNVPSIATISDGSNSVPAALVSITSSGFSPATISVQQGQTVMWLNLDNSPHQPASDPYPLSNGLAGFDDKTPLNDADSYGFRFDKVGTYTYHDQLNPFQYKGTVIVRP